MNIVCDLKGGRTTNVECKVHEKSGKLFGIYREGNVSISCVASSLDKVGEMIQDGVDKALSNGKSVWVGEYVVDQDKEYDYSGLEQMYIGCVEMAPTYDVVRAYKVASEKDRKFEKVVIRAGVRNRKYEGNCNER